MVSKYVAKDDRWVLGLGYGVMICACVCMHICVLVCVMIKVGCHGCVGG